MQMSELSERSGVPIATVKYYLREGLLPAGVATSATRATYTEAHVLRLRLIRALAEVGGLRLDQIRAVLAAIDDPDVPLHRALGVALARAGGAVEADPQSRRRTNRLIRRWRWRVAADSANRDSLATALSALDSVDHPMSDDLLDRYASALHDVAEAEVARVPTESREAAVQYAVVGTLLVQPVISAVRRLAQEDVSARRFGRRLRKAPRSRG
jgi:DNA-binding transcriptional MerR regulator